MLNKKKLVKNVFDSVFEKYDIMNDIMSLGIHRIWKKIAISMCNVQKNDSILDLACGTGDMSELFAKMYNKNINLTLADININMLEFCKKRLFNKGFIKNINFVQTCGEYLPFKNNSFDIITIAFGLRNFSNIKIALESSHRILKKNGKLLILEFSHPTNKTIYTLYDIYSYNIIPKIGKLICNDYDSYKYLVDSIRAHPTQIKLNNLIKKSGFKTSNFINITNGIVAIHTARKL